MGTTRYVRLFDGLTAFRPGEDVLAALAQRVLEVSDAPERSSSIPAGYTYLGQFIIHDLSFEQMPRASGPVDPADVENLRTPRLDLDSLYGAGPEGSPLLYQSDRARMRVGWSDLAHGEDLPRGGAAGGRSPQADIHDSRNDENLIIAQLHLAFIKFHNRVVDVIERQDGLRGRELFEAASLSVRRHYQWAIVHDFLPRLVSESIFREVMNPQVARTFDPGPLRSIPVEFSAAAFRFGHSMIRNDYMLEPWFSFPLLSPDPRQQDLRGLRERPPGTLITDWSHFFGPEAQLARKIDTGITRALAAIPPELGGHHPGTHPALSLPLLDLQKGTRLGLPTGQDVARAIGAKAQLLQPEDFPELTTDAPAALAPFAVNTPLWYYCLKEAEHFGNGSALGPVGGRIVAEVLTGVLRTDPESYVYASPRWLPETRLGARPSNTDRAGVQFGIRELLAFAASGSG